MAKIIITVVDKGGLDFMLLSTWILFAQVMVGIMITGSGLIEDRECKTFDALLITPSWIYYLPCCICYWVELFLCKLELSLV